MIRIDDTLLEELGLMALPKEERDALLRQIYETLEMRVGMKLAERMNDQQLDEFERFIDGDIAFTESYLSAQKPGWQQSEAYLGAVTAAQQNAQKRGVAFNENAVKSEFGALSWLETNFPDYKQVVAGELDKLKSEIKQDSGKIVQAMQDPTAIPASPNYTQAPVPPAQMPPAYPPVQPMQSQQPSSPSYDQNQQPPMTA
ncbi:hypothetical protein KBD20_03075 [Candidatus Saccharibacteria bacterium]|nr:hypothetical protein [Candidatus Saccharibacteria bacterium]